MLKKMITVMTFAYSMLSILSANESPKKPNIVFIMSDDQGNWALGKKNQELITPHLDKLCEDGVMFTNFFCATPVCSPARMSVFTGKMPSAHGVLDWVARGSASPKDLSDDLIKNYEKKDSEREWFYKRKDQIFGDQPIRFLDEHDTYPELLAKNGYRCGISGKWHIGDSNSPQAGFTFFETYMLGAGHYFYPLVRQNGKFVLLKNKYVTDYITEKALEFLDDAKSDEPFYLSVHYTAPHDPWEEKEHPTEIYQLYENCKFATIPNLPRHKWTKQNQNREVNLRGYFTAITAMDRGIGDIIKKLDEKGLRENTIIVFTADNGMSMGHHGIYGKGNATYPQNMYDSAVQVPAIVSCPARFVKNQERAEMLSHCDWMPTFLDLAGISYTPPTPLPGKSFKKLLEGKNEELHNAVVAFAEYGKVRMIRTSTYKLVTRHNSGDEFQEFYDLQNDPDETINLYKEPKHQTRIAEMKTQLAEYFAQYSNPEYSGIKYNVSGGGQKKHLKSQGAKF